ncbi:ER oxidoreductin Ero1a [Schizosaccharomyces octosporus yFS286]|uniref:ER oxidoreductin Ero1a n=1 Tax=Schizosaccharomyces octosporus (strain yFS286) TaxID=483514 RepID=S9PYJ8_SCHOY|nr:ER oxidoreductin Ero1a [Schizosaccharomyces octosporus yFS286]EPX72518.1 ER oxidoreductin Ero1a [Schizosaccharomyces octosporus yFS286]
MFGISKLLIIWHALWAYLLIPNKEVALTEVDTDAIYGMQSRVRSLFPVMTEQSDYFSNYKLNLYRAECPLWDNDNAMCSSQGCAVDTLGENEVPNIWKQLSEFEQPSKKNEKECNWEHDSKLDYCYLDEVSSGQECVYVSLVGNPERFTGYSGDHTATIWRTIYEQNCFVIDDDESSQEKSKRDSFYKPGMYPFQLTPKEDDIISVSPSIACQEKRMLNKIISGFHASISSHICENYYDAERNRWTRNLECWLAKVGNYPERIENIFFNYALLHQAFVKIADQLEDMEYNNNTFCPDNLAIDARTKLAFDNLAFQSQQDRKVIMSSKLFSDEESQRFKETFRRHFHDISRIMDCVGCDKCRLWGKLQMTGYGTALKLLLESETHLSDLRPSEIVALVNTFDRIAHSVQSSFWFQLRRRADLSVKFLQYVIALSFKAPMREILSFFTEQLWYIFYAILYICNVPRLI